CVVWQTALGPVIALELLAAGTWRGTGVLGPEAFPAEPFLELMRADEARGGYGQPWGLREDDPQI
ncbi:ATP-binding protein, partial [Streptomyces sp. SID10244]|nr:ATP-binding protein [Streptomyces sp. SID10244]